MKSIKILLLLILSSQLYAQDLLVKTQNGMVEGYATSDKNIRIFKGIPFAAPPVGDLRWKAPQAVQNWSGVKKCVAFSASPIQDLPKPFYCWSEEFIAKPEPLSEDCLYLNIWTSTQKNDKKRPVFVWIYGGGLSSGSANCDIYDGEEMAKQGVVFVSINYRVGVLGFMAHPELSKESSHQASGNYGFMDQIAALQWVQKNIEAFGGDSNNVTIAGQSAGAFSVNALIASPLARGLFHKAILQSGGILSGRLQQNLAQSEKQGLAVMKKLNAQSLSDLRKIPALDLQKMSVGPEIGRFGVTIDNYVLPDNLAGYFQKGLQNQVPILAGWVTGDGGLLGPTRGGIEDFKKEAQAKYGQKAEEFLSIFPANSEEELKKSKNTLGLVGFACLPAHLLSKFNSKDSYVYQFDHTPTDKPGFPNYGVFHTSEVPYTLHTLHLWNRPWQKKDKEVEQMMSAYWINFAKTGNPNGKGLPQWSKYNPKLANILEVGEKTEVKEGLLKKELDFMTNDIFTVK